MMQKYRKALNEKIKPLIETFSDENSKSCRDFVDALERMIGAIESDRVGYTIIDKEACLTSHLALAEEQLKLLKKYSNKFIYSHDEPKPSVMKNIDLLTKATKLTTKAIKDANRVAAGQLVALDFEALATDVKSLRGRIEETRDAALNQYSNDKITRVLWNEVAIALAMALGVVLFAVAVAVFAAPIVCGAVTGAAAYGLIAGFGVCFTASFACMTGWMFDTVAKKLDKVGEGMAFLDGKRKLHFNDDYQANRRLSLFANQHQALVNSYVSVKKPSTR